jgi:mRNA-degrading endonuclease RelE of RelBE toxin-antitoxin system
MSFHLSFSPEARDKLAELKNIPHFEKRFKAVAKALGLLQVNPRHRGLQTHEFTSFKGPAGEKVFGAYAEQNTPAAYRIFFYYGQKKGEIIIVTITPRP